MKFPFHLIIEYAHNKPHEIDRALTDFFGKPPSVPFEDENIEALFLEWLMYEFKQTSGPTFFIEYVLKNPDHLPEKQIRQFQQIIQTQRYSEYEILHITPGSHLTLEDVFSGKTFDVYDTIGSINTKERGMLKARIACIDNAWHLVGANPIYVPMVYTARMKKMLKREFGRKETSIKDTAQMLLQQAEHPPTPPKELTKKELDKKRKTLEEAYAVALVKRHATLSFADLRLAIFDEQRVNVLDFWRNLSKKGLPEEFVFNETELLQDIWNYFPHQCLGGISPHEAYTKLSQGK